jgi:hypothetical protein
MSKYSLILAIFIISSKLNCYDFNNLEEIKEFDNFSFHFIGGIYIMDKSSYDNNIQAMGLPIKLPKIMGNLGVLFDIHNTPIEIGFGYNYSNTFDIKDNNSIGMYMNTFYINFEKALYNNFIKYLIIVPYIQTGVSLMDLELSNTYHNKIFLDNIFENKAQFATFTNSGFLLSGGIHIYYLLHFYGPFEHKEYNFLIGSLLQYSIGWIGNRWNCAGTLFDGLPSTFFKGFNIGITLGI